MYDILRCDTCLRTTEKLSDQTRAFIDKCTITYKCLGHLQKIGETPVRTLLEPTPSPISSNVQNWVPRGTITNIQTITPIETVAVNTGVSHLTLAVPEIAQQIPTDMQLTLEIKKANVDSYIEYQYIRGSGISFITGPDDSSKRLALRFSNGRYDANGNTLSEPDLVNVFINGIQIDTSLFDRTTENKILFTPALETEYNSIRVVVVKETPLKKINLTFKLASEVNDNANAWGNIGLVGIPDSDGFYNRNRVYVCSDISAIGINNDISILSISDINNNNIVQPCFMLLANYPWSSYDKNKLSLIQLNSLIQQKTVLSYKKDILGNPYLTLDSSAVNSIFPQIALYTKLFDDFDNNSVSPTDVTIKNKYIN